MIPDIQFVLADPLAVNQYFSSQLMYEYYAVVKAVPTFVLANRIYPVKSS
jgi:hypothetical protein